MILCLVLILVFTHNIVLYKIGLDNQSLKNLLTISQIVGTFIAGVALLSIWFQFKLDKQLNEADFLIRLNLNFIENSSISEIYSTLEKNKVEEQKLNPFDDGGYN